MRWIATDSAPVASMFVPLKCVHASSRIAVVSGWVMSGVMANAEIRIWMPINQDEETNDEKWRATRHVCRKVASLFTRACT